jgi:4-aminobutyrate aminotransferase
MSGTDFYEPMQVKLAEKLDEIAPFEEPARVYFCNSGTESVEAALKLAVIGPGAPSSSVLLGGSTAARWDRWPLPAASTNNALIISP